MVPTDTTFQTGPHTSNHRIVKPCFGRFVLATCVLVGSVLGAASQPAPANSEVTVLEAISVESGAGVPWEYVAIPGFEMLSRCPEDFTLAYARALERSTRARETLLPATFWAEFPTPIKVILYDQEAKTTGPFDQKRPIDIAWSSDRLAVAGNRGIHLAHPGMVGDGDVFFSCGNYRNLKQESSGISVDLDGELRLKSRVPLFPSWFLLGMYGPEGVYTHPVVESSSSGDVLILPNAWWISPEDTVALQAAAKQSNKRKQQKPQPEPALMPLASFFAHPAPDDPKALWTSQAALFVRWGLFAKRVDGQDYRAAFLRFADEASRSPVTESLFQDCFGLSYAEAESRLSEYLLLAVGETLRIPLVTTSKAPPHTREATSSDVARILGNWARLQARELGPQDYAFREECSARADKFFLREAAKQNANPLFLAEYGLYAAQKGEEQNALEALERAASADALRPRGLVELARLRFKHALPSTEHGFGDLSPAEFSEILRLLATARTRMPDLLASYQLLIQVFEHAPEKPSRDDLAVVRDACALFQTNAAFVYRVATLYRRCGYTNEATQLVNRALLFASTPEARATLSRFSPN